MSCDYLVHPGGALTGTLRPPGDKSISHRALMLGSLARGRTRVDGFLEGEDSLNTLAALRRLGVSIDGPTAGRVIIDGVGLRGLKPADGPVDLGNAGTSIRLFSGLLAGQAFDTILTGDASLRRRPMDRVVEPLQQMGARIEASPTGTAPLTLRASEGPLTPIDYVSPIASAQVKSCVLLAGLYAEGRTCVREPAPSRDHTERMLEALGATVTRTGAGICVTGFPALQATPIEIPADISSAAFFLVGASIAPGSDLVLEHIGLNPTRTGVLAILERMGADLDYRNQRIVGGEPVADIRVRSAPLHGIDIPPELVPRAIDEFPALFIAAARADGVTRLTGAAELRVKESDRIAVMADGLHSLGIAAEPTPDGIVIHGGQLGSGTVASGDDHRVAMAFAMAGLAASGPIRIPDCANVATSFPDFPGLAARAGLGLEVLDS